MVTWLTSLVTGIALDTVIRGEKQRVREEVIKRRLGLKRDPLVTGAAFRAWFGDSKIVDEHGLPLVVWHGSPILGFPAFDKSKINPEDPDAYTNGFWFSQDREDALRSGRFPWRRRYAQDAEVRPFYLSMRNPAGRRDARLAMREARRLYRESGVRSVEDLDAFFSSLGVRTSLQDLSRKILQERGFDGYIHHPTAHPPDREQFEREGRVELVPWVWLVKNESRGSVDLYEGKPDEWEYITGYLNLDDAYSLLKNGTYVAFEPTLIKSTDNVGTFDPEDPRVRYGWRES